MTSPVDICQLALAEGATRTTINGFPPVDNSPAAVSARLFYTPKLQMLLRSAPWDSARAQTTLTLIKQAFINGVASSDPPPQPFQFEYLWPASCLRARFIMQFQTVNSISPPLTTGQQNVISPAYANTSVPFVIANDPLPTGQPRKVILTNMQNAMLVYTSDISQTPDMWDAMFSAAATATLASYFIANLAGDQNMMRSQIQIAKGMLDSARGMNGSEGISNQDRVPDWIAARMSGGSGAWSYGNQQAFYSGWDQMTFPTGLTY